MKIDQEIREGRDADRVLNDPLFTEAFAEIERDLIEKMRRVPMADRDTQHELVLTLQLMGNLRQRFVTRIQTGKMSEMQKDQDGKRTRRV